MEIIDFLSYVFDANRIYLDQEKVDTISKKLEQLNLT